ncbi:hypothetical protein ACFOLD_15050 [Kocuria carniphila]|uniref:hypothetical protein n=1 Tax=Kocuria carniphila TaxID=262208 RepID=UPI00360DA5CA
MPHIVGTRTWRHMAAHSRRAAAVSRRAGPASESPSPSAAPTRTSSRPGRPAARPPHPWRDRASLPSAAHLHHRAGGTQPCGSS